MKRLCVVLGICLLLFGCASQNIYFGLTVRFPLGPSVPHHKYVKPDPRFPPLPTDEVPHPIPHSI